MDDNGEFLEDSNTKKYSGAKLTDFVAKTKEVADQYNLPFVDNYYELGINQSNIATYFNPNDGVHPNAAGRELIAKHIGDIIVEIYTDNNP